MWICWNFSRLDNFFRHDSHVLAHFRVIDAHSGCWTVFHGIKFSDKEWFLAFFCCGTYRSGSKIHKIII